MRVDVALVLDELVVDHLLQVAALRAQLREPVDHILDQVEPVDPVLDPEVEGRRDRALLLVAADMEVVVGPAVGEPVDQPRIAVEAEDDVLVLGEERVVVGVGQPVGCSLLG